MPEQVLFLFFVLHLIFFQNKTFLILIQCNINYFGYCLESAIVVVNNEKNK